ncbi:hypothetical protein [Methanocella sp. MCL-LM]
MEKCSKCKRNASLPFYAMLNGKLVVLCFTCACKSSGLPGELKA